MNLSDDLSNDLSKRNDTLIILAAVLPVLHSVIDNEGQ